MLNDDWPPHAQAEGWTRVRATGNFRQKDGKLQQEFAQDWWNNCGGGIAHEWRDVPVVDEVTE